MANKEEKPLMLRPRKGSDLRRLLEDEMKKRRQRTPNQMAIIILEDYFAAKKSATA